MTLILLASEAIHALQKTSRSKQQFKLGFSIGDPAIDHHMAEGALSGVQGCIAPPFLEMDCNAPPNFENFISNVPQMGVQNQIPNKAMHPCFEIPNAPPEQQHL